MPPSPERRAPDHAARLRVLIVTDEMEVGGTQRQIVHIARGLDPHRFDVTVLYFRSRSYFVDQLEQAGVRVLQIEKRSRLDPVFVWRLVSTIARGRFDVMHCFAFSGELWGAVAHALMVFGPRPVLLSSIRGTYDWYGSLQWKIKRWVARRSWRVVANSRVGAAFALERMGLPASVVSVIYNGVVADPVAPQAGEPLRRHWHIPAGTCVVLFAGRLVDVKDVPTLLRAMARLREKRRSVVLVIAGDGPLRAALESQAESLGLGDGVRFLGQRDDVGALIDAADVVVLPSRREGLSNVVLEGMLGARPVVASRAGGNVELVDDDRTGALFEVGDDAALACALERLGVDADLRSRLGAAGRERARASFSVAAMVRAFEQLYVEAHADKNRLRPVEQQR